MRDIHSTPAPEEQAVIEHMFRQGYRWAQKIMQMPAGQTPSGLLGVVKASWNSIDEDIDAVTQANTNVTPACKVGCSTCCVQDVQVSTPELLLLAMELHDSPHQLLVRHRAKRIVELRQAGHLSPQQRYAAGITCPLLVDRKCISYDERPTPCRGYFSADLGACKADWAMRKNPEKKAGVPIIASLGWRAATIRMAVDAAMLDAGLEVERVELSAGLHALDSAEPDIIERWARGEPVFRGQCDFTGDYPATLRQSTKNMGV